MTADRILVAIDDSAASQAALARAVAEAQARDTSLDLCHVIDTRQYNLSFTQGGDVDGEIIYNAQERALVMLEDLAKPLEKAGVRVNIHVRFGSPRSVIALDMPNDYHTTLIVVGRSTKKMMSRMFIGSVAAFVVANAQCDVLVVANPEAR